MERKIKRVFITGVTGAAGRCFSEWLQANYPEVEIHGTARNKNACKPVPGVELLEADLLDMGSLVRALEKSRPDVLLHFAANPDKGFEIPVGTLQNNIIGTANLFEAARLYMEGVLCHDIPIVMNVSSSEIYGDVRPEDIPITEECPTRPVSPYGVSKLAQDHLGRVYAKAYGLPVITTRAFTYINNRRPDLFTSQFARQIALIERGELQVLKHGNLDSVRVMLETESICEAYWLAATKCRAGEAYNLGGDERVTVMEVLSVLRALSFKKTGKHIPCQADPALLRPVDVTLQVPDCSKFKKETGWDPKFDLQNSMERLLGYWRKEVAK